VNGKKNKRGEETRGKQRARGLRPLLIVLLGEKIIKTQKGRSLLDIIKDSKGGGVDATRCRTGLVIDQLLFWDKNWEGGVGKVAQVGEKVKEAGKPTYGRTTLLCFYDSLYLGGSTNSTRILITA